MRRIIRCMTAAKSPKTDTTEQLLTEIRDLLKAQQQTTQRSHVVQMVFLGSKVLFYVCAFVFAAYAASYYATTIVNMTSLK